MSNEINVYQFYVMDEGWEMFPTVSEIINKLSVNIENDPIPFQGDFILQDFLEFRERAFKAAKAAKVTEGFATNVHVMPLVDNFRPSYALAWKAAKGGWCIVVSQEQLKWLEALESCTVSVFDNI